MLVSYFDTCVAFLRVAKIPIKIFNVCLRCVLSLKIEKKPNKKILRDLKLFIKKISRE